MWRSGTAAATGVGTGAAAHVMLGGSLPGVLGFLPALVLTTLLGAMLLRKRSTVGIAATALSGQWMFHELAVLGSPYAAQGHTHHSEAVWEPTILSELPMTLGHLVAAVVTGVAIVLAERIRRLSLTLTTLMTHAVHRLVSLPTQPAVFLPEAPTIHTLFVPDRAREIYRLTGHTLRAPPLSAH
ncbi:hypothetical protein C3B54_11722 [Pontimonas salivibrio]|uniref:Uncharacterized protein n=2 Tax=Pontimonas salivibrio TaxID=1159327 RepID=A0A2L2BPV6_9MICO|nr:hypothetical protein C3B54_11722 [Pontimonas salivibrio]